MRILFAFFVAMVVVQNMGAFAHDPEVAISDDDLVVKQGQFTFAAEGTEGGLHHSRKPHLHSKSGGVTIGRGYDMGQRQTDNIVNDLMASGMSKANAEAYKGAAGLKGKEAMDFLAANQDKLVEITKTQQKKLFESMYEEMARDVKRISDKAETVKLYGKVDWDKLDPKLKEGLIDLRVRGDYTPTSRKMIQKSVANNDFATFKSVMENEKNWPRLAKAQFQRGVDFVRSVGVASVMGGRKGVIKLPQNVPGWVTGNVKNVGDIEYDLAGNGTGKNGTGNNGTGNNGTGNNGTGNNGTKDPNPKELDEATRMLAATAYGEGSTQNVPAEMAAIANVLVRQQKARGYSTILDFLKNDKTFAFAAHDGNQRYQNLMGATPESIAKNDGMSAALDAARNALSESPTDYSNGAYFWDGADVKSNYKKHPKVRKGVQFTDPSHDIYGIGSNKVPGEEWWRDSSGKKTKLRGKWDYTYDSTATHGGTIFWQYNPDFRTATGTKEYK
jgi:Bacterial toxin homologue of phage lysozyme, C-term